MFSRGGVKGKIRQFKTGENIKNQKEKRGSVINATCALQVEGESSKSKKNRAEEVA